MLRKVIDAVGSVFDGWERCIEGVLGDVVAEIPNLMTGIEESFGLLDQYKWVWIFLIDECPPSLKVSRKA